MKQVISDGSDAKWNMKQYSDFKDLNIDEKLKLCLINDGG